MRWAGWAVAPRADRILATDLGALQGVEYEIVQVGGAGRTGPHLQLRANSSHQVRGVMSIPHNPLSGLTCFS
jgi:hypothetical protein